MRKLFTLTFVLISSIAFAQNKDTVGLKLPFVNGKVVYEKSFKAPGQQQSQLYSNAQLWFVERYKSDQVIQQRDHAAGRVSGNGTEVLIFKGPLKMDVSCKVKMNIEIESKDDDYIVRISDIIYGYQAEPTEERAFFSAEDMINYLTKPKYRNADGINPVPFNKTKSRKALESLTPLINNMMASISQTMSRK
ncbi:MAG TPA: DUF4468 domain-containing protein [Mucilaginibacter sp.]|jgi:hypothetical protein|nr:DUF4468 domain-containing protein [Mucilaginibacter sp.]